MRPIDADLLLAVARDMQSETEETAYNFLNDAQNPSTEWECVEDMIENAPTLDYAPVVHAHWYKEKISFCERWLCSNCEEIAIGTCMGVPRANFCPNCGAKME